MCSERFIADSFPSLHIQPICIWTKVIQWRRRYHVLKVILCKLILIVSQMIDQVEEFRSFFAISHSECEERPRWNFQYYFREVCFEWIINVLSPSYPSCGENSNIKSMLQGTGIWSVNEFFEVSKAIELHRFWPKPL